jgi:hypothetical protein
LKNKNFKKEVEKNEEKFEFPEGTQGEEMSKQESFSKSNAFIYYVLKANCKRKEVP